MALTPLAPAASAPALLGQELDRAVRRWRGDRVLRVATPVEPVDPLLWAAAQTASPTHYWRGRSEAEAWAGVGVATGLDGPSLDDLARLGDVMASLPPDARLATTARFDSAAEVGEEWTVFGAVRLVLPRVELRSDGKAATLAVHLMPGESPRVAREALAAIRPARADVSGALPLPYMRRDDPARAEWDRMLRWALGAFATGDLGKVVLARRARFLFEEPVDAVALLRRLEAATPRPLRAATRPRREKAPSTSCRRRPGPGGMT